MLPSSTISQSVPISRASARRSGRAAARYSRVGGIHVLAREPPERVDRHRRIRRAQAGARRDDEHASPDERIVRRCVCHPRERARVGQLAAEIQAAHEAEDVANRRVPPSAAGPRARRTAPLGEHLRARRPEQLAGDRRKILLRYFGPSEPDLLRTSFFVSLTQGPDLSMSNAHLSSTEPTVNPAPTDASSTRSPA